MKLNLVLGESALELVPKELWRDQSVVSDAKRRGVEPSRILLDRSFHHRAMLRLKDGERRGRPDLVHTTLLSVTGTPLYADGKVRVLVHTYGNMVVEFLERTRIPKSYFRFRGLMEQALAEGRDTDLLKIRKSDLDDLLRSLRSDRVVGLSVRGRAFPIEDIATMVMGASSPTVVIGGFPRGHFGTKAVKAMDELVSIHERPLEAHVVAARLLYEVERRVAGTNH